MSTATLQLVIGFAVVVIVIAVAYAIVRAVHGGGSVTMSADLKQQTFRLDIAEAQRLKAAHRREQNSWEGTTPGGTRRRVRHDGPPT